MVEDSGWVFKIDSIVFTEIKRKFSSQIKTKYKMKNENFSTDEFSNKEPSFPHVLVNMLVPTETTQNLEMSHIEGGTFTFQIEVTDNESKARAKEVMIEVNRIMKLMRFKATMLPCPTETKDVVRYIARYRRNIDEFDVL